MKKYLAICGTLAALAWVGVAAAAHAARQADRFGADQSGARRQLYVHSRHPRDRRRHRPLYIGTENDKSGNCDGDSGILDGYTVVCAHFVASSKCCNAGSPRMRFAYQRLSNYFVIAKITDNGASTDTVALGATARSPRPRHG